MNCAVCGGPLRPFAGDSYLRCVSCEFISLRPELHPSPEKALERYSLHSSPEDSRAYDRFIGPFLEKAVYPYISDGYSVLDYGAGRDRPLEKRLSGAPFDVFSYDPFYEWNTIAARRFDMVCLVESIEHFERPGYEMGRIRRLLGSGGHISVMTLLFDADEQGFSGWWYKEDITHLGFYSVRTMETIAGLFGLSLVFCDGKRICVLRAA